MFYEPQHSAGKTHLSIQKCPVSDFHFPLHLHTCFEWIFVEEGLVRVEINNQCFEVKSGQGALILPGQPHAFSTPRHSLSWVAIFSEDYVPELKSSMNGNTYRHPVVQTEIPHLHAHLQQAQANPFRIRAILYALAARYAEGEEAPQLAVEDEALVCRIVAYIHAHYTEPITLKQISQEMGYSYRYMSGVINRFFKQPLPQVVNQYRIDYACDLLVNTEKPISEIALRCGFGSIRNFNRCFCTATNRTPQQYRSNAGGK